MSKSPFPSLVFLLAYEAPLHNSQAVYDSALPALWLLALYPSYSQALQDRLLPQNIRQ